jgi:hypothetical protein
MITIQDARTAMDDALSKSGKTFADIEVLFFSLAGTEEGGEVVLVTAVIDGRVFHMVGFDWQPNKYCDRYECERVFRAGTLH